MTDSSPAKNPAAGYDPGMPVRAFATLSQEHYIEERLNDQLRYYDRTAGKAKNRYLQSRLVSVVAGALVPVLVNLEFAYVDVITTILSVLVVLIVSLESVFHFREQWVNSRSTSEALRKEYFEFTAAEGLYADFVEDGSAAFRLFVERVEAMIEAENLSTLQVMTRETRTQSAAITAPNHKKTEGEEG